MECSETTDVLFATDLSGRFVFNILTKNVNNEIISFIYILITLYNFTLLSLDEKKNIRLDILTKEKLFPY